MKKPKVIVILGPTASGKSDLAVRLARRYDGEVISADSRQVYKGLTIASGKITKREMNGIRHHLLDIASPTRSFSVAEWKTLAEKAITNIIRRDKLPIICGGTAFYIQSIVDNIVLPEVKPNPTLRKRLSGKTTDQLFAILKKLDPARAETVEKENPVRLIRSIEIATAIGTVPKIKKNPSQYDIFQIGLRVSDKNLAERIRQRTESRMKRGMVREARELHAGGLSWKRMRELGLEYRYLADFLDKKTGKRITRNDVIENIERGNRQYARRQMRWWKRDKRIRWYSPADIGKIEKGVDRFLKR